MAKQIFYSVRRRDFLYLQGIEPNENYKAGAKAPTMGTPHISADYRSIWGKEERMFEPLTLASYIKIILEEYRWEDRLPDDLAILCHVDKRYFWDEAPKEEKMMATYVDPINGGCACAREKCDNTCETYVNRTIPGKTRNYTVTRDEIAVTPNGEVAIARRDVQTGTVTMIPLIVVDGKVYAATTEVAT